MIQKALLFITIVGLAGCAGTDAKAGKNEHAPPPRQLREASLTVLPFQIKMGSMLGPVPPRVADTAACGPAPFHMANGDATDSLRRWFFSGGVESFFAPVAPGAPDSNWVYGAWRLDDGTATGEWKGATGKGPDAVVFAVELGVDSVPKMHALVFARAKPGQIPEKWQYAVRADGAPCVPPRLPPQVVKAFAPAR